MSYSIYDIHLNFLNDRPDRQIAYTVNAEFAPVELHEDNVMLSDCAYGHYALKSSLYPNANDLDAAFPYQVLLPQIKETEAILVDRLNGDKVILTARVNSIYQASTAYGSDPDESAFKLFIGKHNLPPDIPRIDLEGYVRPRKVTPFEEFDDRIHQRRSARREYMLLVIASVVAIIGIYFFSMSFVKYAMLNAERTSITAEIAKLNAQIPPGNLSVLEYLDKDDMLFAYLDRIIGIAPSGIVSVTKDGIVFKSYETLEALRKKENAVKVIDTTHFFLQTETFTIPSEAKK